MAGFVDELTVTQLGGGEWLLWRLEDALLFTIERPGIIDVICVPRGFVTDGPSIPRPLWAALPVWGRWGRAGVIHDYLCCLLAIGHPHRLAKTRLAADRLFWAAMADCGVGRPTMLALYLGVRIGAWLGVPTRMAGKNAALHAALIEAVESAE